MIFFLNIATQIDKISVRFETLKKKRKEKNNACFVSDLIDPMQFCMVIVAFKNSLLSNICNKLNKAKNLNLFIHFIQFIEKNIYIYKNDVE